MQTLEKRQTLTQAPAKENSLAIRPAQWDDMENIANFVRSTAEWYRPLSNEKDMAEHSVDENWKEVNFQARDFYVGYDGDTPIGTLSLQYFGDYAYIGYLYLDASCVGKGYGKQFMQFAEKTALKKGLKGLFLISHPEAHWAVKAYEKFGFVATYTEKEDILKWNNTCLETYYEENFHIFIYDFEVALAGSAT